MAKNLDYQKKYENVSLIGELDSNGNWETWNNASGTEVQLFIKDKLEDAIVDFEYAGTTLNGYNAFGQIIASTPVVVTDPTFRFEEDSLHINEFRINGDLINTTKYTGNANSNLTASLNFTYNLILEIGGEAKQNSTTAVTYEISLIEENGSTIPLISPITGKCNWTPGGININAARLKELLLLRTNRTSKLQIRLFIDYTVTVGESKTVETAEIVTKADEMTVLNLRRLCLTYSGASLIKANSITLSGDKVDGTGIEDKNNYKIEYALNGETIKIIDTIDDAASPQIPLTDVIDSDTKVLPITLCARIISNDELLSSDWLPLSLLYQKSNWTGNTGATAIISNIPSKITNCDAPALFQIITTDKLSGNVKIYAYKSNNLGAIQNISTDSNSEDYYKNDRYSEYLFKLVNLSLNTAEDHNPELKYYSYVELDPDSLGASSTIYLVFIIEPEVGEAVRLVTYYGEGFDIIRQDYNEIKIVTNKYGKELLYTTGAIIDYSQISTTNTFEQDGKQIQLFEGSNLNDKLDSSDGLVQDGKYVGFKVSPLGETEGVVENLFKNPIHLMDRDGNDLLSTDKFSIELNLKTYNVNDDDDLIAKIGNIYIYPHYLRVYEETEGINSSTGRRDLASIYEASCANFSKDEETNIIITYDATYKAKTYNALYDDLYHSDTSKFTNDAPTYPCLKIYINGTINRSVSISKSKLGDSYFNIHPSSANINIYGFRTYARCLSYDEILKNRISSMTSFEDKELYYINNDILYKLDDFTSSDWIKISDKADTICFEKVLGTFKSVRNRSYNPKNVILIVTDDRGPMMFANTNGEDASGKKLKLKDATMFVKYADAKKKVLKDPETGAIIGGNGKLIGQRLVDHFAYDEYYKALGSSAKRYGGAYNVQYAKFWYIPELYINEVSENLKYVEKTAEGLVLKDDIYIPAASSETGYAYKVYSKTHPEGEAQISKTTDNKDTKTLWKNVIDTAVQQSANKVNLSEDSELAGLDIAKDFGITDYDGSNVVRMTKSVGKVNYASSMLSHKPGGTDLFAECYPGRSDDYCKRRAVHEDPFYYFFIKLSDCKDKADGSRPTFWTVTWDDIDPLKVSFFGFLTWGSAKMDKPTFGNGGDDDEEYLCIEGADNKNQCTNFKTPWAAQQMWADTANQLDLPFYAEALKKSPDDYVHQHSGKNPDGTPNYTEGLLFYDETIMFRTTSQLEDEVGKDAINKNAESWDIAGNALTETPKPDGGNYDTSFTWNSEGAKVSLSRFAEWFNSIYCFDFGNLEILAKPSSVSGSLGDPVLIDNNEDSPMLDIQKKYIIPADWYYKNINAVSKGKDFSDTTAIAAKGGNVLRYDPIYNKWVNAGLYFSNDSWEVFNIIDLYNAAGKVIAGNTTQSIMLSGLYSLWITYITNIVNKALTNSGKEMGTFFTKRGTGYPLIGASFTNYLVLNSGDRAINLNKIKLTLSELFKAAIWAYCDADSFAYHQAAIRFLSGTDNRAKNQYFLIKGRKYADGQPLADDDPNLYKYANRDLITLFLDDVDTIFATDNNGQLAKPYNLIEPAYNLETISSWGDSRSGLWYNFDIVFNEEIKSHLRRIISWATGGGQIIDKTNPLYTRFLKMQDVDFAPIAYNHTSEIYYDVMQSVYNSSTVETGALTTFGNTLSGFAKNNFNDNQVSNPESLVHGSCIESERQFLKKRIALLASFAEASYKTEFNGLDTIGVKGDTAGGTVSATEITMDHLVYIQDYYPKFVDIALQSFEKSGHDPIIDFLSKQGTNSTIWYNPNTYVYNKVNENDKSINYAVSTVLKADTTQIEEIQYTSYIKEINFTKGMRQIVSMKLPNASVVTCDPETYEYVDASGITLTATKGITFKGGGIDPILYMDSIIPNVEILRAPYSSFNVNKIDFSNCTRLKELDLSNSTYNNSAIDLILLPKSSKLTKVVLPSNLKNITIEYYPGITSITAFTFDSDEVYLESISLNMKNNWALDFLNKYAESANTIILTDLPETLSMKSSLLLKLAELTSQGTFVFNKNITITLEDEMTILLKALLASVFGDIDSTSTTLKVKVKYTVNNVTTATIATGLNISKDGIPTYNLEVNGNDIKIKGNALDITYSISNGNGGKATINTTTGYITLNGSPDESILEVKVVLATNNGTITAVNSENKTFSRIIVGFRVPKLGDFAYADGTFSEYYTSNKTLVGFVYFVKDNQDNTYEVRVMSASASSTDKPLGPAYADSTNYYDTEQKNIRLAIEGFAKNVYETTELDKVIAPQKTAGELSSGTIYYTEGLTLPTTLTDGSQVMEAYITKANEFVLNLKNHYDSFITNNITKDNYKSVISALIYKTFGTLAPTSLNYSVLVYPAFLEAYFYTPVCKANEVLSSIYSEAFWYIPTTQEITWLLLNVINGQYIASANGAEAIAWLTASDWNGDGIFAKIAKQYPSELANKFAFLGSACKVSCESSDSYPYLYKNRPYYEGGNPSWQASGDSYENNVYKDENYKVVPCINLTITKE